MSDKHSHDLSGKNLFLAIILNIVITLAQFIGGIFSGSLALISDALHNFTDVLSLIISYAANKFAQKEGSSTRTFGYRRVEIFATLINASTLIAIGFYIIFEAIHRISNPQVIDSTLVIWLGFLGVLVNGGSIFLLKDDIGDSMNIKAAYLHLLGDVLTSVAVVVGGLLMLFWQIYWVDPIISILIALYLIYASYGLLRDSTAILMEFAPKTVNIEEIIQTINSYPQIANAHHLHLWSLDDKHIYLDGHLDFVENLTLKESNEIIERLEKDLHAVYDIEHTVFQCEFDRDDDKGTLGSS
jgi:cobalt-zinc-cadmium efflux system protein